MNFKSTLWALAFACAAVSCSDDLENGPNDKGNEEQGEGVYVTVSVSSAFNPVTKANDNDTGMGEDGVGDLEDSELESQVNDVNIFLIPCGVGYTTGMTSNDLKYVNEVGNTEIVTGFTKDLKPATGAIEHHDAVATVKLSVPELNAWYHVVTVANAGEALGFKTLGELRDFMQTKVWSGNNKYGEAQSFIMTTHQMWQMNAGGSDLYVTEDNSDPDNPAKTTAYVERLAARIDMQIKADLVSDAGMAPTSVASSNDKVKITGYQVVNQLIGGTFMLKRVTGNVTSVDGKIGEVGEQSLPYLSDEVWSSTGTAYNYVLDAWTKNKTVTAGADFPTSINNSDPYYAKGNSGYDIQENQSIVLDGGLYENHFHSGMNTDEFMNFTSVADIATDKFTPLLYTQENTMSADQQKNGFTTGVIFEAEYAPKNVSQYQETGGNVGISEYSTLTDKAFLLADNAAGVGVSKTLSADLRTIAALGLKEGSDVDVVKAMFNNGAVWTSTTDQADVQKVVSEMSGGQLVVAFKKYLQGKLDDASGFDAVKASLTWDAFVTASHMPENGIAYVPSMDDLKNGISGKTAIKVREELAENYNIAYYAGGTFGGKSYYKYWIRHNPISDKKKMGVMEFAIVRNNVYQLQVDGIKELGDPLPFTPGKDDPDDPDKETDIYIMIKLYVKDWVKRSSGSIIL